jgi:hypothetical protein
VRKGIARHLVAKTQARAAERAPTAIGKKRGRRGLLTIEQAIARAERQLKSGVTIAELFGVEIGTTVQHEIHRKGGGVEYSQSVHNLTTDAASGYTNRRDWQSKAFGMGPAFAFATAQGNATSVSGTSLTASSGFPTTGQGLAGCIVVAGPNASGVGSKVYGVIVSNSATVLTIDQWYDPTSTTGAQGTAPNGTCSYVVVPGQNPAAWNAVTSNAAAPVNTDTTLNSELTSNGFSRLVATYAHSAAGSTYTLTSLWTASGTETINKEAQFGAANTTAGGVMPFESAEPSPPTLVSGDTLTNTVTITIN